MKYLINHINLPSPTKPLTNLEKMTTPGKLHQLIDLGHPGQSHSYTIFFSFLDIDDLVGLLTNLDMPCNQSLSIFVLSDSLPSQYVSISLSAFLVSSSLTLMRLIVFRVNPQTDIRDLSMNATT